MSFFAVAFLGMAPFGSFGAGTMAGIIGPRETLLIGADCCLGGTFIFARQLPRIRESVRPIYIKMGIIKRWLKEWRLLLNSHRCRIHSSDNS
jgi:hypothetical protein